MPNVHTLESVTPALSLQPMNFAATDPGVGGWRYLFDQARGADAAGIDRLVVSDHVILGEQLEKYADPKLGGMEGGKQPTGPDGHWLDPIVLLSMWAAMTTHTRLMTGILLAGIRRPASLAKALSTLDVLSEGRLDIGVGVGWQREEYEANGVPYEHRGARLNQTLEICQTLWRETTAAHHSEEVNFEKVHLNPKPLQPGGVPLWISGTLNRHVIQRIARFGSGWIPWGADIMDPVSGLSKIREALESVGRSSEGFQVSSHLPLQSASDGKLDVAATMAAVAPMVEAGITDIRITLNLPNEQAEVTDLLAPIVESFRKEAGR